MEVFFHFLLRKKSVVESGKSALHTEIFAVKPGAQQQKYLPLREDLIGGSSGFGYNGEYTDTATGMIYLRARFYDPAMNRFSQKDALRGNINNPLSLNRYLYCENDPVNFIDSSGRAKKANESLAGNSYSAAIAKTKMPSTTNKPMTGNSLSAALKAKVTDGGNSLREEKIIGGQSKDGGNNQREKKIYGGGSSSGNSAAASPGVSSTASIQCDNAKGILLGISAIEAVGGLAIIAGLTAAVIAGTAAAGWLILGGALLGAGVASVVSGINSERNGESFLSGWLGGEISGAATGAGLAFGNPAFELTFLEAEGAAAIGGFLGGSIGSAIPQKIENGSVNIGTVLISGVENAVIAAAAEIFGGVPEIILKDPTAGAIGKVIGAGATAANEIIADISSSAVADYDY